MKLKLPIAVVAAGGLLAGPAQRLVAQQDDAPNPPVEVTACLGPGPEVRSGTEERTVVPSSDGDITLVQPRGIAYGQDWTEVSDPRLEGAFNRSWDEDEYLHPDHTGNLSILVTTDRIENDEGAWQGSAVWFRGPRPDVPPPVVLVGEGAYEGLTAFFYHLDYGCDVYGFIIDGSIPAAPAPVTDGGGE